MAATNVPRALFHGTPASRLPDILKNGLLRGTSERANFEGFEQDVAGCVFLAESQKDARQFGLFATIGLKREAKPKDDPHAFVVLTIDTVKARVVHGVPIGEPEGGLDPKAFDGRQFVACGDIPPEAIVGYLKVSRDPKTGKVAEEYVRL